MRSGPFERSPRDRRKTDVLLESEARFRALVQNSFDIITIHDSNGMTVYESPAASRILGYPSGALIGKTPFETIHPKDVARARDAFDALLKGETAMAPVILRFRRADGSWIHLEVLGNNLLDHPGIRGIVLTSRDISERKRAEERVQYLANYDVLTGLPNRFLMQDHLTQVIAQAHRNRLRVALMHIDLDRFKVVNETLGHYVGDALLKQAAERVRKATREADTVARVGGDEFTIVFPNVTSLQTLSAAAEAMLDDLARPFPSDGQELFVSASVGISLYPDDAGSVDELIKHADAAMSSAKHLGRNNFQFYTAGMNQEVQDRMLIEAGLRTAIQREELSLVFQPKIDLATRRIFGAEALLRWKHPKLGMIPPSRFVPVAEEAGLVGQIGEWVLHTACRQIREWQDAGYSLQVAVNVSARQFQEYDVAELVMDIMRDTGALAKNLEIELTESAVMNDAESSIVTLERLAALGVQIAIDDFGTGYSSLSYLKRLPLDLLKIDQSFVRDISSDPNDAAIVRAIITLARSLGIKVIAEGVENEAQLAFLNAYGCQYAQGYLFGRPLTSPQLVKLITTGELEQNIA
ncbi:MAG: EAL domain-containing protein [Betaproteobacteria bacterium]|nr:EAL domain-containing protein [Betaproteobacteria bacterium]